MHQQLTKQHFQKVVHQFSQSPLKITKLGPFQALLLAYFGTNYVQGWRIFEKINPSIYILSLYDFQSIYESTMGNSFIKIVYICYDEMVVSCSEVRQTIFDQLNQIISTVKYPIQQVDKVQPIQIEFLFAKNNQFTSLNSQTLTDKTYPINLTNFYDRQQNDIKRPKKLVDMDSQMEAKKIYDMIELVLKGAAKFNNFKALKQILCDYKFSYSLRAVINTIYLIIGKEYLENGYVYMSAEKLLYKSTQKLLHKSTQKWACKSAYNNFKKCNLLMRNQEKSCLLSWKFTNICASKAIISQSELKKNQQLVAMIRREYNINTDVRMYCIHQKRKGYFHKFTQARYCGSKEEIDLVDIERQVQLSNYELYKLKSSYSKFTKILNVSNKVFQKLLQRKDKTNQCQQTIKVPKMSKSQTILSSSNIKEQVIQID